MQQPPLPRSLLCLKLLECVCNRVYGLDNILNCIPAHKQLHTRTQALGRQRHKWRVTSGLHGKADAEPPQPRKMPVFSWSNKYARALEHLDEQLLLSIPRGGGKEAGQINTPAKKSHTSVRDEDVRRD
jgi:hypothetical protein